MSCNISVEVSNSSPYPLIEQLLVLCYADTHFVEDENDAVSMTSTDSVLWEREFYGLLNKGLVTFVLTPARKARWLLTAEGEKYCCTNSLDVRASLLFSISGSDFEQQLNP